MALTGEYLGMTLTIEDVDAENIEFFGYCAKGEFRLQRGKSSGLLRYPPTTGCPWTAEREADWVKVEGKGTVHSYAEVHHAIQPAFKAKVPYMVLVVDLDEQKGKPTEHEALRVAGNLVMPDGELAPPEVVRTVGVGTRVRMVFSRVGDGFSVPNWTLDHDAEQPADPWRYPQE
ncbi:MAG: OB-fold domain-containing protein [Gammaproteobacteria bacterium]|nr:OB-fold domain-containing protein [Gammaproteobacteria bacterium]